jgi:hypothetical protein
MDDVFVDVIVKAYGTKLDKAAKELFNLAEELADYNSQERDLKDKITQIEAGYRPDVATALNDIGKPKYSNLESQNAMVVQLSNADIDYKRAKIEHAMALLKIEKHKAKMLLKERARRDARSETDLRVELMKYELK